MPLPQRYFTRKLTSRTVYRDDAGRFVSKEVALRRGLTPNTIRFYEYRDQNGKRRSQSFVSRQRKRVITVTQAGDLLRRESDSTAREVQNLIGEPSYQSIQSQQFRRILNDAVSRGVAIGVQYGDTLYEIPMEKVGDLESAFTEIEYEYIRLFEPLAGGVYLQMLHAESPNAELFDFDSFETGIPAEEDDEELRQAMQEFQESINQIWNRYFGR
jgi:hypothetical protein